MCRGRRLIADFAAGTSTRPDVPEEFEKHLTTTVDGLWVVWAHKLARQAGELFIPLTGGPGYPADARAECRSRARRGTHDAPDPRCTCGFHALSVPWLPGLPGLPTGRFTALTVVLSGRVLAFEWDGEGILWRAERQTVVSVERMGRHPYPGDPDGRLAAVSPAAPRDSGPVRLKLPVSAPLLRVSHDDAGWCAAASALNRSPAALALA